MSTLQELQRVRSQHLDDPSVYWALTVAIDLVLGINHKDDLRYLTKSYKENVNA